MSQKDITHCSPSKKTSAGANDSLTHRLGGVHYITALVQTTNKQNEFPTSFRCIDLISLFLRRLTVLNILVLNTSGVLTTCLLRQTNLCFLMRLTPPPLKQDK